MSNIVTCYKWVYDESDIKIRPDLSVDISRAQKKISEYDNNTIEAGKKAGEAISGQNIGITVGPDDTRKSLKPALARGLDRAIWVNTGDVMPDSASIAKLLAKGIEQAEDVALILCTDGSGDLFARQTAPRLAAVPDIPVVTGVTKIEFDGSDAIIMRKTESALEKIRVKTPAVLAVLPEINDAPIPGLREVMKAGKKETIELAAAELGYVPTKAIEQIDERGSVMDRKMVIFKDEDMETMVSELVQALRKEGVL